MEEKQVAIREQGYDLALPDMDTLTRELTAVRAFQTQVKKLLIEGHDFGVIPGTDKPTLFQPGAEKMDKILHLSDRYDIIDQVNDWTKPFFYYQVRCRLIIIGTDVQVAEGLGSCNSYEDRYRWRWVFQSQLPIDLQGDTGKIERDRMVSRTISTKNGQAKQYRTENDNIFSLVNTLLKMARKRAHIAASLSAGRLSDVFTQDMEDIGEAILPDEPPASDVNTEHFCQIHHVPFFKKGNMKSFAHTYEEDGKKLWCNEPDKAPDAPVTNEPTPASTILPTKGKEAGLSYEWVKNAIGILGWKEVTMVSRLRTVHKLAVESKGDDTLKIAIEKLTTEQAKKVRDDLNGLVDAAGK
jgi:hypothetical protein